MLRAELTVAPLSDPGSLNGCGLILVNPPWTLENELAILLPALAASWDAPARALSGSIGLPARGAGCALTLWPLSTAAQLVCSSMIGSTFRLLMGAGGVTEAVLAADAFPEMNVRPSRRAWAGGGAVRGRGVFPMAQTGVVKFFIANGATVS